MNGVIQPGWAGNWEYVCYAWGLSIVVLAVYAAWLMARTSRIGHGKGGSTT